MNQLNRNSDTPLYLQLSEILQQQIACGLIKPGDKLMSESHMVKHYGVARLTVREALNHLVHEGLVEKQHGKGSFCKLSSVRKNIDVLLDMNEHYFIPFYMQSISAVLDTYGANLIAGDTKNSNEEIIRKLEAIALRGSDGVILQGCPNNDVDENRLSASLFKLSELNIPVIIIDYEYEINDACYAVMDEQKVGHIAAEYFLQCGHKKTAVVCVNEDGFSKKRFSGFRETMGECTYINANITLKQDLMTAVKSGVTGIFCYNDPLAKECIDIFQDSGFHVPEDISIIGVDDTILAKFSQMTSVAHPKQLLGEYAAKEILRSTTPKSKIFDPVLVVRNSVKTLI